MKSQLVFLPLLAVITMSSSSAEPSPSEPAVNPKTLSWSALTQLPSPPPGERISYGSGPQQFGELRIPTKGEGPFPVFVLVHGGCWLSAFDYVYFNRLAGWLTDHGVATWTIEYRRLGDDGSGWPGTFLDVAQATDALREMGKKAPLDLDRVYTAGHSAGGHLALWLASRSNLPKSSELYSADPLPIRGVLGLAAITDLETYRIGPPDSCNASVEPLIGGTPDAVPSRYAETSPLRRLPLGVPMVFIQGEKDPIVSPASVRAYVEAAKKAGDDVTLLPLPSAGHFETSVPLPMTEPLFSQALELLLKQRK